MKLGDRVTMRRAQYTCEGTIVGIEDGENLLKLATLGRGEALATQAQALFVRGIAVSYNFTDPQAIGGPQSFNTTAVLLQDHSGQWFDLFARRVDVELTKPEPEQLTMDAPASGNAYPD